MISKRNLLKASLLSAAALLTAGTSMGIAIAAEEAAAGQPPPPGSHDWHHHGGPWHLLGKLNLSDAQKQQVKDVMTAAHPQLQSLHEQMHANSLKLEQTQPTDPNYANVAAQVSQTHGTLSAQMMTQHSEIRAQIFKILTPAQQTQLATLEAQMQSHHRHGPPPAEAPAQ
jgi:protein CpxP